MHQDAEDNIPQSPLDIEHQEPPVTPAPGLGGDTCTHQAELQFTFHVWHLMLIIR